MAGRRYRNHRHHDDISTTDTMSTSKHHQRQDEASRQVQFANETLIHYIPDRSELNITKIWYNRADMLLMRPQSFEVENASGCSTKHASKKNKGECMRGLEGLTKPGSLYRTTSVRSSIYAVLDEQRYGDSKDLIPEIYSVATRQCQEKAHIMALIDELFVKKHVYNNHQDACVDTIQSPTILKTKFGILPLCTCHTHKPKQQQQRTSSCSTIKRASSFLLTSSSKKAGVRRMTASRKFFPTRRLSFFKNGAGSKRADPSETLVLDDIDDDDQTADTSCTFSDRL